MSIVALELAEPDVALTDLLLAAERFQSDWYRHYRDMFCAELFGDARR